MFAKSKDQMIRKAKSQGKEPKYLSVDLRNIDMYRSSDAESILESLGYRVNRFPEKLIRIHPRNVMKDSKCEMYLLLYPSPEKGTKEYIRVQKSKQRLATLNIERDDFDSKDRAYLCEYMGAIENAGNRLSDKVEDSWLNEEQIRESWKKESDANAEKKAKAQGSMTYLTGLPARLGAGGVVYIGTKIATSIFGDDITFIEDNANEISAGSGIAVGILSGPVIDWYVDKREKRIGNKFMEQLKDNKEYTSYLKRVILAQTLVEVANIVCDIYDEEKYIEKI